MHMSLSGRLAATGAAVVTALVPGVALAAGGSVDESTGPVAYAFTGGYDVPAFEGTDSDRFNEQYRSPLEPGVTGVRPGSPESVSDFIPVGPLSTGTSWFIHVNAKTGMFADSVPPPGASENEHFQATAHLSPGLAPSSVVRADYMLEAQNSINDPAPDQRWLFLDDVRSDAVCQSSSRTWSGTTAARMWVRQPDRSLASVPVPSGSEAYQVEGIKLRLPVTTMEHQHKDQYADVSVRQVTSPADLVGTDQWRTGEVNAASGWRVDVASYVVEDGVRRNLETSRLILGGVSCSLPKTAG